MTYEFIAKKGLIAKGDADITPKIAVALSTAVDSSLNASNNIAISNGHAFVATQTNEMPVVELTDRNNIRVIGTGVNDFYFLPVVEYSENVDDPSVTVVHASTADETVPEGAEVQIDGTTGGVYDGVFISQNSDFDNFTFEIPVAWSIDPDDPGTYVIDYMTAQQDISAIGTYVYVVNRDQDLLAIFDVNIPEKPVLIGTLVDHINLKNPVHVEVVGNLAWICGNNFTSKITAVDISNPRNPVLVGVAPTEAGRPSLAVQNDVLYSATSTTNKIEAWDISNPTAITLITSITDVTNIKFPHDLVVRGGYLFVTDQTNKTLVSWDISQLLTGISFIDSLSMPSGGAGGPYSIELANDSAYISDRGAGEVHLVNIADPTTLVMTFADVTPGLNIPEGLALFGNSLLVCDANSTELTLWDIGGLSTTSANIGQLLSDNIRVLDTAHIDKSLHVGDGVTVSGDAGLSNDLSVGGDLDLKGTLKGDLDVENDLTVGNDLSVINDLLVGNDLSVIGAIAAGILTWDGTSLKIGPATTGTNPLLINSNLDANTNPLLTDSYHFQLKDPAGGTGSGFGMVWVTAGSPSAGLIATDRGSGNATSLDFYLDSSAGAYQMVMRLEQDGSLGLGTLSTDTVNEKLHVNANGTSSFTGGVDQGILITDTLNPRVVFEDVGDAPTKRVMEICNNDQALRIQSLLDDGSGVAEADIATFNHSGSTPTMTVGRRSGNASILAGSGAANGALIMDSIDNFVGINYYSSDDVILALGSDGTPGKVGIGQTSPEASAVLDVTSTTSGFLEPRMTTAQRDAISAAAGLQIYNTDTTHLNFYDGSLWIDIGSVPANTYEIWTEADLPNAPSGGEIVMPSGRYLWMQDITISDNIIIEDGASVQWVMPNGYANSMTFDGTGTFISTEVGGSGAFRILDQGITIYLTQNNVTLFDITGTLGIVFAFFGFQGTGGAMGQMIGSATGVLTSRRFFWLNSSASGWTTGLTLVGSNRVSMDTGTITSHANATGAFIIQDDAQAFANYTRIVCNLNSANASFLDIRPLNTNDTAISRIDHSGDGDFFQVGSTGAITAVADATNGPNAISSVTDNGGSVQFNGAGAAGYEVGSVVTFTGFSESTYNVTARVTEIVTSFNFVVGEIAYVAGDSGSGTEYAVLVTSATHGLSNLDQVNITETVDYNGGYEVIKVLANTYEIAATWVATETGTWDDGSLTETNKYVDVSKCGEQASSQTFLGSWVSSNAIATSVTGVGTWDPVNFEAIAEDQMEGFQLLADGSFRVETLHDTRQAVTAEMTLVKSGNATPYRFRWRKTTGAEQFSAYYPEHTISAASSSKSITAPANMEPGDIFRLEVEQVSGATNDFTVTHAMITS